MCQGLREFSGTENTAQISEPIRLIGTRGTVCFWTVHRWKRPSMFSSFQDVFVKLCFLQGLCLCIMLLLIFTEEHDAHILSQCVSTKYLPYPEMHILENIYPFLFSVTNQLRNHAESTSGQERVDTQSNLLNKY